MSRPVFQRLPIDSSPTPFAGIVSSAAREALLGHRGVIVWLTGLSAAGKSTLAEGLERELLGRRVLSAVIDGDVLRTGLSAGLGFSLEDRKENIRRAGESALLLAATGVVVVVALISPFRADRDEVAAKARARGVPFAEIYVNASLDSCERRDPKGLYRKARAGELKAFTGIDSPYEAPLRPALELCTDRESVGESLEKLSDFVLTLARPATVSSGAGVTKL